jgi:hypothetical protein
MLRRRYAACDLARKKLAVEQLLIQAFVPVPEHVQGELAGLMPALD